MTNFELHELNQKSRIFGQMFQRASEYGKYEMRSFVKQLMTEKCYEDMLMLDERFEWADDCVLLSYLENIKSFKKKTKVSEFSAYELRFIGHLYKYWMRKYNVLPCDVYKILPFDKFHNNFGFYHTQGEEYIIQDATKNRI